MALALAATWLAGSIGFAAPIEEPPPDNSKNPSYERYALTHPGNPEVGRKLFRDEKRTRCVGCHKVEGEGSEVGPDLSRIGGKFDRPHLIESLLEPSRQIVEGYRASVVVTNDGRVTTGVVKEESAASITLVDPETKRHVIPTARIKKRENSPVSLMPAGLADALTATEFTDLIAYLETLRPGGQPKFGAGIFGPIKFPGGFEIETLATGLTGSTALETTADGRVFVCEQTGALRVVKGGRLLEKPFVVLPVDRTWERGLIGVTPHTGSLLRVRRAKESGNE